MTTHPNVAVVVMDTTRARETVPAESALTPTLASIADAGTEFTEAVAPAPWTLPSHASTFTGTYPSKHGAHGGSPTFDADMETLAETFAGAGYETVAVSNNTWISDEFGMDRGFETLEKTWQVAGAGADLGGMIQEKTTRGKLRVLRDHLFDGGRPVRNLLNALYLTVATDRASDDGAAQTNDWIRAWLADRDDDRPFFLFVNYLEPHIDYRPPAEFAEPYLPEGVSYDEAMALRQQPRAYDVGEYDLSDAEFEILRGLYRGSIAYLDARIGDLLDVLGEGNELDETLLVVTSDHGENVGDHGLFGHQYNLYNTALRVPMVMQGGPFTDGHPASDDLVQHVDLAPTLLDAAGVDAGAVRDQYQGRSLLADDYEPRTYAFSEYLAPQPSMDALERRFGDLPESVRRFDRRLTAVQTTECKLIRGSDGLEEYFRLSEDPAERTDLSGDERATVRLFGDVLDDWRDSLEPAPTSGSVSMTAATEERLADLGYLQ
jgi:arylsulfatase A-like enzyme